MLDICVPEPLLLNLPWSQAFHLTSLQMELRHPYNHRRFVGDWYSPFLPQDPTWSLVVHNRLTFRVFQKRLSSTRPAHRRPVLPRLYCFPFNCLYRDKCGFLSSFLP
ncbi:hypothetical protein EVAR_103616_1 [Eumeta japonica]|uniref:Uncharacterized protein n=1 Tax=Eumeta variegata TaxID=151549 RepID=A0A4C1T4S3_EUMVA|nr:hypothetical protein EVAR_103616_1 [Eumeta japonica]